MEEEVQMKEKVEESAQERIQETVVRREYR